MPAQKVLFLKLTNCWLQNQELSVSDVNIIETKTVKLLEIEIDNKLSFEQHINNLCKSAAKF